MSKRRTFKKEKAKIVEIMLLMNERSPTHVFIILEFRHLWFNHQSTELGILRYIMP